uniref:Cytochrome c oxidase subunit 3 n=1 Tax=Stimulopalpus japonicus TaxID=209965 RepID=A0A343QCJ2_9NEOP|nr:cytochrome c oxidase subunit III [Stimulopalpus japonicus]ATU07139.1 cytochrome c oxidase subunit III [Stimulopalpus japonicus]
MNTHNYHPYHLVNVSPWPLTGAIGTLITASGLIELFNFYSMNLMIMGLLIILFTMFQWWRDIVRESTYQGLHSIKVAKGMRWGMILFITSEVFFFLSFFWAFFHSSLAPSPEIGLMWPPKGIQPFNPIQIPLLNTIILLSSGFTITWAHHSIMKNNFSQTTQGLTLTILLGFYFTLLQGFEYWEASFSISDSIYGSSFFMATGFHGLHVIIGTIFITTMLMRHFNTHFSKTHHFGFEAAAWYWHFVDVVWLFLYISIYWWGN